MIECHIRVYVCVCVCYLKISDLNYTEDWCNFPSHYI